MCIEAAGGDVAAEAEAACLYVELMTVAFGNTGAGRGYYLLAAGLDVGYGVTGPLT